MVGMKKIGVALVAAGILASGAANANLIYDSFNAQGVSHNPYLETLFSLGSSMTITSIVNYHYGYTADPANNWIGIEQLFVHSWVDMGHWSVAGEHYWVTSPNITLGPGNYRIVDSDPTTWAYSDSSYFDPAYVDGPNWVPGRGFTQIYAEDALQQSVPEPMSLALLGLGLAGLAVTRRRRTVGAV